MPGGFCHHECECVNSLVDEKFDSLLPSPGYTFLFFSSFLPLSLPASLPPFPPTPLSLSAMKYLLLLGVCRNSLSVRNPSINGVPQHWTPYPPKRFIFFVNFSVLDILL